ncbi:unnamed protein product [Spirodela intermedia]|uniref:Uncharacterized protein n=1 Tax=Spirodela intermedia TaxID=51605 RepID=A0A7I8ITT7_SPIIN|nr:unnamed protein product [Spirodela intermedia]CAA6661385.1 unnamed protein product [Spirodela intermedia]
MKTLQYSQSNADRTLFFKQSHSRGVTMLLVYVDDLIITENDDTLGRLRYLLSIEVAHSSSRIFNSQRKYITDLLAEIGKSACKPTTTPIDPNHKRLAEGGVHVSREMCQRLIGCLLYLTHNRPDISYVVSQFIHQPKETHLYAAHRALHYLRGTPDKRILFKRSGKVNVEMFTNADYAESIADQKSKHLVISHLLVRI